MTRWVESEYKSVGDISELKRPSLWPQEDVLSFEKGLAPRRNASPRLSARE